MKILVLCGDGFSSNAVVNALLEDYSDVSVICEDSVPRSRLVKRRIKKLGLWTVFGQLIFAATVPKILRKRSISRINEIISMYKIDVSDSYKGKTSYHHVDNVNSDDTINIIADINPDIVVVNGTRIISERVLNASQCPIINMHAGITPKYRGVHGAYWAVANDDLEHCGVTIHEVNKGIDTGAVIKQALVHVTEQDNYCTYPYLQLGEGIIIEKEVLKEFNNTGTINTHIVDLPSKLWSHPTIWEHIRMRIKHK